MPEINAHARAAQTAPQAIGELGATQEVRREWLSYRECETLAGLSRTTIWRLINAGEIEAARVGRAVRISRESLTAYMKHSAETPSPSRTTPEG
jgi:excisionase family DNA binding protein